MIINRHTMLLPIHLECSQQPLLLHADILMICIDVILRYIKHHYRKLHDDCLIGIIQKKSSGTGRMPVKNVIHRTRLSVTISDWSTPLVWPVNGWQDTVHFAIQTRVSFRGFAVLNPCFD